MIDFSVQNFLSIREKQTLSFVADKNISHLDDYYTINVLDIKLLKIGLIFGSNAAGKTNILKALDFFRDLVLKPKLSKSDTIDCPPFLLDDNSHTQNSIFEINFIWNDTPYFYTIELNKTCVVREILKTSATGKTIYTRNTDLDKQIAVVKFGNEYPIKKDQLNALVSNTLWNNTVIGGYLKTNIDNIELKNVKDWFSIYLRNIITPRQDLTRYVSKRIDDGKINKDYLISILQQADFNISDILIKKEEEDIPENLMNYLSTLAPNEEALAGLKKTGKVTSLEIKLQHVTPEGKTYNNIPFRLESLGTQRYYGLAGILYTLIKESHCFSIDELESSLHPELYIHFLLSYCVNSHQSQIIATTHNREILNNKNLFRNDMINIADKTEVCSTVLYRLSDLDTSVIRNTSNILNAYNAGRLGGIPNLGDYYINLNDGGDEA